MPSIGRQFGKGECVPHKDLALAALGVDVEGDRGSKGPEDEIRLSAEEHRAAKETEGWDMNQLIEWAQKLGDPIRFHEDWVREKFTVLSNGTIEYHDNELDISSCFCTELPKNLKVNALYAGHTLISTIPPNLQVKKLYLFSTNVIDIPQHFHADVLNINHTGVSELPSGLSVNDLSIQYTKITHIPEDLQVDYLTAAHTDISEIPVAFRALYLDVEATKIQTLPSGLQVEELVLVDTDVAEIPIDKGAIKKIRIRSNQVSLRRSAIKAGIRVIEQ